MIKYYLSITLSALISLGFSQGKTKRVLFLGNSYTYVNDLPKTIADMAITTGDTLLYESNCPGGYTLQGHATNTTSLSKIAQGNWDYVVLQEQSQFPSFPINQVETDVFPYAKKLDSLIHVSNPCAQTVFYMTWGRKNGDASNCPSWPPVCTYNGMDSLLRLRYETMAVTNKGLLSPVGVLWKYLRTNAPLLDLYQSDESHPSEAGTYAAACSFYTVFFRKDPTAITFKSTLALADGAAIRNATKTTVFDQLTQWHIGEYDPNATFTNATTPTNQIVFTNTSTHAATFTWFFGDGDIDSIENPIHTYSQPGSYNVILLASKCNETDTFTKQITVGTTALQNLQNNITAYITPNPVRSILYLGPADIEATAFSIFDPVGRIIQQGSLINGEKSIPIGNLQQGSYFIQLKTLNNQYLTLNFNKTN